MTIHLGAVSHRVQDQIQRKDICICLFIRASMLRSIYQSINLSIYLSIYLSNVYPSIHASIHPSIYLALCNISSTVNGSQYILLP